MSHRTAIKRTRPSAPVRQFYGSYGASTVPEDHPVRVLDWGCGRGDDVKWLNQFLYFEAEGYDPHFKPQLPKGSFDVVMLTYVLNTLDEKERLPAITAAWAYLKPGGMLHVAARAKTEIERLAVKKAWDKKGDGWVTSSGTFQHGMTWRELRGLVLQLPNTSFRIGYCQNHPFANLIIMKGLGS